MIRVILFDLLLFGVSGYALLRGTRDARIVAIVCIAANFASAALKGPVMQSYSSMETGVLAVDVATLIAFTFVALTTDRFWPLWVSGLQLTTSIGHVFKGLDVSLVPIAYAAALRFWSYPILIILAVGTWRHQRRAREERAGLAA
ncbi:MAG: hypothetical protein V4502_04990 [Pseudomonadota bacterium]